MKRILSLLLVMIFISSATQARQIAGYCIYVKGKFTQGSSGPGSGNCRCDPEASCWCRIHFPCIFVLQTVTKDQGLIQGNFEVVGSTLVFTASSTISLKSYSTNLPNDVALDPDSSRKLGYSSVVVLAGKYDITKGTTLNYKVKLVK